MDGFYGWVGFLAFWALMLAAAAFVLTLAYARWFHRRFGTLGGKNKRQISLASWHETVLHFKGERRPWGVDEYPFAWLRGLSYRMPWSERSFVFIIGVVNKARFQNLTGKEHPLEAGAAQ